MGNEGVLQAGWHVEGMREARFGIPELDALLGGLFWGENVFWGVAGDDAPALIDGLVTAAAAVPAFTRRVVVGTPGPGPAGFEHVPASAGLDGLAELLDRADGTDGGTLLVVDLRAYRSATDGPALDRAVVRVVQHALRHGIVVVWFDAMSEEASGVQTLAQCVVEARGGHLRIDRADGRSGQVRGAMLPFRLDGDGLHVEATSAASVLGRGLRAVRRERGWSQAQLAALVGVSGSAISQAERGQHALSLETVIDLTGKLGISIDRLLRGAPPSYELARAHGVGPGAFRAPAGRSGYLIDDDALRLRTVLTRIPPRGGASSIMHSERPQVLLVGAGLVQVVLPTARPILRQGDALTVRSGTVSSCRNLGDEEALVFWQEFA